MQADAAVSSIAHAGLFRYRKETLSPTILPMTRTPSRPQAAETRRSFLKSAAGLGLGLALTGSNSAFAAPQRLNVLLIILDDLRPSLGCYGDTLAKSPALDRFAANAMLFERAYCQQALCAPSRASLMTGCLPATTRVTDMRTPLARVRPDLLTLPKLFRNAGYATLSLGKVFHHGLRDDPGAWTQRPWEPRGTWQGLGYTSEAAREDLKKTSRSRRGNPLLKGVSYPFEISDARDEELPDGMTANEAIRQLRAHKGLPFFMAVGFSRPHLPMVAPRKFWDMYQRENFKVSPLRDWPSGMPAIAQAPWDELRRYTGIPPSGALADAQARELIHAYYASISYADAQVGRVLDELEKLELREETIVVILSDHGSKLSEYGAWGSGSNLEVDTHTPLILRAPGMNGAQKRRQLVELADVYPTVAELCGLRAARSVEGTSLVPIFSNPFLRWRQAALSQFRNGRITGYSVRSERHRYTEWRDGKKIVARELYEQADGKLASSNLADDAVSRDTLQAMSSLLQAVENRRPG